MSSERALYFDSLRFPEHAELIRVLSQWPGVSRRDEKTQIVFSRDNRNFCWIWRRANRVQIWPPLGARSRVRRLERKGERVSVLRLKRGEVETSFYDPKNALRPVWSYVGFVYPGQVPQEEAISLIRQSYEAVVKGPHQKQALPNQLNQLRHANVTTTSPKAAEGSFDADVSHYRENLSYFLSKYKGKYIAIINKAVVDEDEDFSSLAKRVFKRYGCRDIFMPYVTEKERIVNIPSPRVVREQA